MTKKSMCEKKVSFHTKAAAQKAATAFNQTVYECPICFCYHCTSKPDWRHEFVPRSVYETQTIHNNQLQAALTKKKKTFAIIYQQLMDAQQKIKELKIKLHEKETKNAVNIPHVTRDILRSVDRPGFNGTVRVRLEMARRWFLPVSEDI